MIRGFVTIVEIGLIAISGALSVHAQSAKAPVSQASQDAVFKFRLIGPTTDIRAKLSDERRWQTRTGVSLAGEAHVSQLEGHIDIERVNHNGPGPSKVTLSVSELSDADQATIRSVWPSVKAEARQLGLLVPFAVRPQWIAAQPKIASRYTRAIAVEPKLVIFRSGNDLYAVPKTALTQASYEEIARQFNDHHLGRYVRLTGRLTSVFGKLLHETDSDFIFEAIDPPLIPGSVWQGGQQFRVPKFWLNNQQLTDLQLLLKRFPLNQEYARPTLAQTWSLPCLRMLDGIPRFCESDPADPDALFYLQAKVQKQRESVFKLLNRDHLAMTLELIAKAQPTLDTKQAKDAAFERMVAAGQQRERWECAAGNSTFQARLRGKLGDVYVFDELSSDEPFYAFREQLSELDQAIIETIGKQQKPGWIGDTDLVALFSRRLLINNGYAIIAQLGTRSVDVVSALEGQLPVIQYVKSFEYPWPALDYTNLAEIERSRQFVATHREMLTARNLPQLQLELPKFFERDRLNGSMANNAANAGAGPSSTAKTPDNKPNGSSTNNGGATNDKTFATPLPVLPKLDRWKLLDSRSDFVGELVGEYQGDWVFEVYVNSERKYFLASPAILSAEAKRKGETMLKRSKPRAWDELLTRAHNWQYFRVWYDPEGKVRPVTQPSVVLSISDTLIRFQHLDGSQTSDTVPVEEAKHQRLVDFFQPAFEEGQALRNRAEEGLTLWRFRDCEPTQRATLVGEGPEDILVKDSRNVEFLINKACLDEVSVAELEFIREETQLRAISGEQAQSLPRVWCTRQRLIGPATPVYMTLDNRLEVRFVDGSRDFIRVESLTLRERLAYENRWRMDHGISRSDLKQISVKGADVVLKELRAPVAAKERIESLPPLNPELVRAIDSNLANWQHLTWPSTPLALEPAARLLAINDDATFGVVEDASKGWYVVELASGKRKLIRTTFEESKPRRWPDADKNSSQDKDSATIGKVAAESGLAPPRWTQPCWMYRGTKVYWIEAGQVHVSGDGASDSKTLTALPEPIAVASQSTDYSALVLRLSDTSTYRLDLSSGTVRLLATAPRESSPRVRSAVLDSAQAPSNDSSEDAPRLWASTDGTAFTAFSNNAIFVQVPPLGEKDVAAQAFLATNKAPLHVAVNRDAALVQADDTGSLSKLAVAVSTPAPTRLGMPFDARWFGIINWQSHPEDTGSDVEKEVIQLIGKPKDAFFDKSNYFFVHQRRLDGDYHKYAYQYVQGELNEQMRVAANGTAIVHHRDGKFVVSRRPAVIPVVLRTILFPYIRAFVEQQDIGQLEALGRYLEQPRFQSQEAFPGSINHLYQDLVRIACFEYQPQLGGDRLERAMALADRLWRKYPDSQVAGNVLVDIHRNLAWSARGGGYADSVTDAGWESFRREMKIASEYVKRLMNMRQPMAPTYRSAIDIEMATTRSLDGPRALAGQLLSSQHVADPQLQHAMAFLLLPRWHGAPGMSEAYLQTVSKNVPPQLANEVYAQQVALLMPMLGYAEPVTNQLQVDLERIFQGTKEYYARRRDGDLLDTVILILAVEKKDEWVRALLELRAQKRMLPGAIAALHALSFRNIEANVVK